jgi:predicted  nucleic acid-binding Zn-ribbon protein
MTLLFRRKPQERQRLPRVANMTADLPAELQSPVRVAHAEEARRVAMRHLEQEASIDALTEEVTAWRARAMAAEVQLQRMLDREQQLLATIDEVKAAALRKNERFTETLTVVKTQFATASRLLLDGFEAISEVASSARSKVDVDAIEQALRHHEVSVVPQDEPVQSVATEEAR